MIFTIHNDNSDMSNIAHHKTPDFADLLSKTEDVFMFSPHWQSLAFSAHTTNKKSDFTSEIWNARMNSLLNVISTTNIYATTSFIGENTDPKTETHNTLNGKLHKHLTESKEGIMALENIPGYPDNASFHEHLSYITMQLNDVVRKVKYEDCAFRPKALLSNISDEQCVSIDISQSMCSMQNENNDILFSLLSWIMANINNDSKKLTIQLPSSFAMEAFPMELRMQMAIKGMIIK